MFREALERVLADRLEHREAAVSLANEALVDERGERLQLRIADRLCSLEAPAAGEHRQPGHELLLLRVEQLEAPFDRCAQRLLPLGQVPCPACEERQPLLQPFEQGVGRQELHEGGCQLDREREAVEPAADLGDGSVGREIGPDGASPLAEQRDCVALGQRRNRILLLQRQA